MKKDFIFLIISFFLLLVLISDYEYLFITIPCYISFSYFLVKIVIRRITTSNNSIKTQKTIQPIIKYFFILGLITFLLISLGNKDFYENTFGEYNFFWKLTFVSLIPILLSSIFIKIYITEIILKNAEILLSICIGFFMLCFSLGFYVNTQFYSTETVIIQNINYKSYSKGRGKSGPSYKIYLKTKFDQNERFVISKQLYNAISDNETMIFYIRKGILGYNYAYRIKIR